MNFIKVQNGIATREPIPDNLPVSVEALASLSWLDPSTGLHDCAWWPEVVTPVPYNPGLQILDGTEKLTLDVDAKVVRSQAGIRNLTEAEREEQARTATREASALTDKVTAAVYARLANLSVFMYGYQHREAAALTYRDAGYEGEQVGWVTSFAEAAGMPYKVAVDLIIKQGEEMREAVYEIERLHMGKYRILRQPDTPQAKVMATELILAINAVRIP